MKNKFIQYLKQKLNLNNDTIKKPYYYVPICPNCGSNVTGKLVKSHDKYTNLWLIDDALKNGEIVIPSEDLSEDCNCGCLSCNMPFYSSEAKTMFLTLNQIEREKIDRETIDMYKSVHKDFMALKKSQNFIMRSIGHF